MDWLTSHFEHWIVVWGYWAVAAALLGENAGIPLPGETVLLFASFLAFKNHQLELQWIIATGVLAATVGDNIGYFIGHRGGRPLLERWKRFFHIDDSDIGAAEKFVERRGTLAIFVARFIAGMRIVAGPLAGVLRMEWRRFAVANAAGAALWVTTIALVGYFFGSQFQRIDALVSKTGLVLLAAVVFLAFYFWRRKRRKARQSSETQPPSGTMAM